MRVKEMITNLKNFLLPNKFSPPVLREMLREHSVENIYVYVRVWRTNSQYKEPIKSQQEKKNTMCSVGKYKIVLFLFVWLKG